MSFTTTEPHRKRRFLLSAAGIAAVLLITAYVLLTYYKNRTVFSGNNPQKDDGNMSADLLRLSEEDYEAVFLSMHPTDQFQEDDFAYYRGLDTLIASHAILNTKELSQYLESIFLSENTVSNLYLSVDPELLWTTASQKAGTWEKNLAQDLFPHIAAHPETSFSILLPYPYIDYWVELSEKKLDALLNIYHALLNGLCTYPNVSVFFPGAENWLTLNPANYENTLFDANQDIARSIFLHTFCDGDYRITPENEAVLWNMLRENIAREKSTPLRHIDLSDWCLVFFGDSVLGNYPGSFSIPGYVNGLSDALVFNYAVGGTPAAYDTESASCFPNVIDRFLTENVSASENGLQFTPEGTSPEELAGKKLCFVINYGFNDYFAGFPVKNPEDPDDICTFKGSLRTGISRLQEAFPDSCQIIMTPTNTQAFGYGTEINSVNGDILSAYIDAAIEAANETGAFLLDNYHFIQSEEDIAAYLADGVHPGENGRLLLGDRIIRFIDANIP